MAFKNHYKQMKAPYVVYADFECSVRKIATCEPDNKRSFTVKTEKHEPCGFSYFVVRSDGQTQGPIIYIGEDAVFVFLTYLQNHEREMREDMANKRPLVMTNENWKKQMNATECHICNKSLVKDLYLACEQAHLWVSWAKELARRIMLLAGFAGSRFFVPYPNK